MINAVRWLREQTAKKFRIVKRRQVTVRGHKAHKATSCPGPALTKLVMNGTFQEPSVEEA
jgi:hypothetical protein